MKKLIRKLGLSKMINEEDLVKAFSNLYVSYDTLEDFAASVDFEVERIPINVRGIYYVPSVENHFACYGRNEQIKLVEEGIIGVVNCLEYQLPRGIKAYYGIPIRKKE